MATVETQYLIQGDVDEIAYAAWVAKEVWRVQRLIDRGHRELPIEANFIGKKLSTQDNEVVEVKLTEIDGEDAIYVMEKL